MLIISAYLIKFEDWTKANPKQAQALIAAGQKYETHKVALQISSPNNLPLSLVEILTNLKKFRKNIIEGGSSEFSWSQLDGATAEDWVQSENLRVVFFQSSIIPLSYSERRHMSEIRNTIVKYLVDRAMYHLPLSSEYYDLVTNRIKMSIQEIKHKLPPVPDSHLFSEGFEFRPGVISELLLIRLTEVPIWREPWFEDPEIFIEILNQANRCLDEMQSPQSLALLLSNKGHTITLPSQDHAVIYRGVDISPLIRNLVDNMYSLTKK